MKVVSFLLFLVFITSAFADGGSVISQQLSGPYRITLFGSPSPLRAGPADLSILIQDIKTGNPILNQSVAIQIQAFTDSNSETWIPPCCSMKAHSNIVAATHIAAQNKLLYAANLMFQASGPYEIFVRIGGKNGQDIKTQINIQPPLAPFSTYWIYLAFPPMLVGIFALNQRLHRRRQ